MSWGPFSLLSTPVLETRTNASKLNSRSQRAPPCVAPRDIFPDYERVMARLRAEEGGYDDQVTCHFPENVARERANLDLVDSRDSDDNSSSCGDDYGDDGEYRDRPRAQQPVSEVTNTHSNRSAHIVVSHRSARKSKPYEGKHHLKMAVEETPTGSQERCVYVDPEDGRRCNKINKSPQEAGRHWRSCHLYKEAKAMLTGVLPVGQGTAIKSKAQLEEVIPLIQCPFCSALITRSDAMRRHVRTNCRVPEEGS
ncbi:hypothetical protein K439DRAFT_1612513 [Ramaria rubella]|nr:hypothetical protein K439DRAFT_1612513 [Ramaria rubella]